VTDTQYTAVSLLVDRSGSMAAIRTSAQDAIREFVLGQASAAQQNGDRRTIRLAVFDHEYELIHHSRPAEQCPKFTLEPRGTTALLDAMGQSIHDFGVELAAMPPADRPATVIYAILTDGIENDSQRYTYDQIAAMVRHQEKAYGWDVLYLAANQDAIATAARLGVAPGQSITYAATDQGTRSVMDSMSGYVATAAAGGPAKFTDNDRDLAVANYPTRKVTPVFTPVPDEDEDRTEAER